MKGLFTQGAVLLLDRTIELAELEPLLRPFGEVHAIPGTDDWTLGEATLLLPLDSEGRGHLAVDFVARPWPDEMGGPEKDANLFAAWSMGHFGPCTFPGALGRASRHAWIWPEAQEAPPPHAGFLRLRTTFNKLEAPSPAASEDYDPLAELLATTRIAEALARHPAVIAYFNASGETLLPPQRLAEAMIWSQKQKLPPLDVWSNVRFFNLEDIADGWFLMDTVGMGQLNVPDHEVFLPGERYDFKEVEGFLRNLGLYLMEGGKVEDGDFLDGPGGVSWKAQIPEDAYTAPPRRVLRWFAADGAEPPPQLTLKSRN